MKTYVFIKLNDKVETGRVVIKTSDVDDNNRATIMTIRPKDEQSRKYFESVSQLREGDVINLTQMEEWFKLFHADNIQMVVYNGNNEIPENVDADLEHTLTITPTTTGTEQYVVELLTSNSRGLVFSQKFLVKDNTSFVAFVVKGYTYTFNLEGEHAVWTSGSAPLDFVCEDEDATMDIAVTTTVAPNLRLESSETVSLPVGEESNIIVLSDSEGDVTFESSDTSKATVDENGKITAVAEGSAVITVSQAAHGNYTADEVTVNVTVVTA